MSTLLHQMPLISPPRRFASVDSLRGLTVAAMLIARI
jgi:hypothetical protein